MKERTFKTIVIIIATLTACLSILGMVNIILPLIRMAKTILLLTNSTISALLGNDLIVAFQVLICLGCMKLIFLYIPMALASFGLFRFRLWGWKVATFVTMLFITSICIDIIFMPTILRVLLMMTIQDDQLIVLIDDSSMHSLGSIVLGLLFGVGILFFLVRPYTLKYFAVQNFTIFMGRAFYVGIVLHLLTLALTYFMLNSLIG